MSEFALLKRIVRHIRYEKLDKLVNRAIPVENWNVLESSILNLISPICSQNQVIVIPPINLLAFAKYGLLDTTIEVSPELLANSSRKGIRFLDEMGWLDMMGFAPDEEASCLTDIWKDIDKNKAYLQLYLQAQNFDDDVAPSIDTTELDEESLRVLRKLMSLGGIGSVKKYPCRMNSK